MKFFDDKSKQELRIVCDLSSVMFENFKGEEAGSDDHSPQKYR
jgi:hypothetical protein